MTTNNVLLTLQELVLATNGNLIIFNDECSSFCSVATDSRNVQKGGAFFPLIGEFQDGHKFIKSAIEKEASVIVAAKESWNANKTEFEKIVSFKASVVLVENTLFALQQAAAFYVKKFPKLIKVAITGSNGKTTTKELVSSVLETKYNVVKTQGNLNSETGLPLSVFNIKEEHEVGVFEFGMNRTGEIKELADVLFPHYAIITNIGTAHIGILGSKDNIAKEKKDVFANFTDADVGFVPETDEYADFLQKTDKGSILLYGTKSLSKVKNVENLWLLGTSFEYDGLKINLHLSGQYNFMNALSAVALAEKMGLSANQIKIGLEKVLPLGDRNNIVNGKFTVVKDCYNANTDSMSEALKFYGQLKVEGKKTFILGDMLELGKDSKKLHKQIGSLAVSQDVDTVIFVGKEMKAAFKEAKAEQKKANKKVKQANKKVSVNTNANDSTNNLTQKAINLFLQKDYTDKKIENLTNVLLSGVQPNDLFFIKGSRGIRLERIAEKLADYAQDNGGGQ